jgi:cob(I)alamin adenosyltransferase
MVWLTRPYTKPVDDAVTSLANRSRVSKTDPRVAALDDGEARTVPRVGAPMIARLEADCDAANEGLAPLSSFLLPGGAEVAARLHLAATVTRRAERSAAGLPATAGQSPPRRPNPAGASGGPAPKPQPGWP